MRNHAQAPSRACGAPGAWKQARRVREAVQGNGPADKTGTAPWTDFTTHLSRAMRKLIAARDWLTVYQLPPYASELNPVEGVWSVLKDPWPTSLNATSGSSPR